MGIRVSYGNRSGIADAIASGLIPKDSFIIGTYSDDEAELLFQDKNADLRHLVAQTRFDSAEEAIQYAISHSEVGQTISVLEGSVYTAHVVQPDFSLRELGMGKFRTETIEELVGGIAELRDDVAVLKAGVATLEGDVAVLKDKDLELAGSIGDLQTMAHTHENKILLDSITEDRVLKWDTGIPDVEHLPVATSENKGAVKSTTKKNGVSVAEDGTMEVNSLSVGKLTQEAGSVIVIRCGSATE